jgi:hypothetical protein
LDALLIALYVEIDDHVISAGRAGCGQPRKLSDAEPVCLAVAQVLLGARSEHHWLRVRYGQLGHLLPYLLTLIGDKGFAGSGFEDLAATGGITHLGVCPSESVQLSPGCGPVPSALTRALRDATW